MFNSYHSLQEIELKVNTDQKITLLRGASQSALHLHHAPCAIFFLVHYGDPSTKQEARTVWNGWTAWK
jgi:hypothetical protein